MNKSGFLIVNKPRGMTSRDVVDRAAAWFPKKTRLGHGGTLDPLATGVLVLAFGHATRFLEYVQRAAKTYTTRVVFGAVSDTDDADGTITPRDGVTPVTRDDIERHLPQFTGDIIQTPPAFSAAKIAGRRAYDLARQGREVDIKPRSVRVDRIQIDQYEWPSLSLTIDCGKGTYIRSIARDLGQALGCGGYVAELHRVRIGEFALNRAIDLTATPAEVAAACLPMHAGLDGMPMVTITPPQLRELRFGRAIGMKHADAEECAGLDETGELVVLGRIKSNLFQPFKVIPLDD